MVAVAMAPDALRARLMSMFQSSPLGYRTVRAVLLQASCYPCKARRIAPLRAPPLPDDGSEATGMPSSDGIGRGPGRGGSQLNFALGRCPGGLVQLGYVPAPTAVAFRIGRMPNLVVLRACAPGPSPGSFAWHGDDPPCHRRCSRGEAASTCTSPWSASC